MDSRAASKDLDSFQDKENRDPKALEKKVTHITEKKT
jgi:hypothetical protein